MIRPSELPETVVVFDLDDTLYPEEAYVRSGIAAACAVAADLYGVDHSPRLLALRADGERDWLARLCELLPPAPGMRDCLLWAYRLHVPNIVLAPDVRRVVDRVVEQARATAIISDGRSVTQRLKLRALGLCELPTYISDEYGGLDKPDPARFHAIMADFPCDRYLYVADNPAKDFVTPKALGWRTVGVLGGAERVHAHEGDLPETHRPDAWIAGVGQLLGVPQAGGV